MARLTLTLLGGFQARLQAGPALTLPTQKARALLAYLALPPGQEHPRDKLATLLWGDMREKQARNSLRQALFTLRKALRTTDPVSLRIDGDAVALDPGAVEVDAVTFERLMAEGTPEAVEQAVALYRGTLLEGLTLQEPPFEEWLMTEREGLRELALEGLAKLLAHQRSTGATQAAVRTARRILVLDALQEAVHRTLMRLYVELGRRGAALQQYQLCVNVLQREFSLEPEAETRQLYQEILRQRSFHPAMADTLPEAAVDSPVHGLFERSHPGLELDAPLIGRASELAGLHEGLEEAGRGRGRLMAIIGEAGIGKSRLISALATAAVQKGYLVLFGRSYEAAQILPFGPWVDAFRTGQVTQKVGILEGLSSTWRVELARLFPELAAPGSLPATTPSDHLLLFEGVAHLIAHLVSRQPLVLILEDLHWADEMSLRLLAFLGRRLEGWSALVAVTAREEELADAAVLRRALEDLTREQRLVPLTLSPLAQKETLSLVQALARPATEAQALARLGEQVWAVSKGNPFLVVETMRALADGEPPETLEAFRLPQRVREVVAHRLERLSERSQSLVAVAAVIAQEFDFALLWRAAELTESDAAAGVEELVRRRVLHGVGERFDFTHDWIREVAYTQVLSPRRKLLHRQVAEALEALYAANLEPHHLALGVHYREGEMWDKAVTHLRRAGANALQGSANREAVSCFEQALAALGHLPESRDTIEQAIDLRFALQSPLTWLGELEGMLSHLREAESLAEALGDQHRAGRVSAYLCFCHWWMGNLERAVKSGERALAVAMARGDFPLEVVARVHLARCYWVVGEIRRGAETFKPNVETLQGTLVREHFGLRYLPSVESRSYAGLFLAYLGDFAAASQLGEDAVRTAESAGHAESLAAACWGLGRLFTIQGHLHEAIAYLERAVGIGHERKAEYLLPVHASALGHVYALSGRIDEGLQLLEQAVERKPSTVPAAIGVFIRLTEAYLLAGRLAEAMQWTQQILRLGQLHGHRLYEGDALRILGEIHLHRAPPEFGGAEASYRQALAMADELGMRPLLARCHLGLGKLYRRTGDRPKAQEHLTMTATMLRQMDMRFWLEQAEAELKALGSKSTKKVRGRK
ncbi:MAG: AAA family ATPase [Anaerolineae bacterium]